MPSAASRLRRLLTSGKLLVMPCCYDALSAKLTEQAGFNLTFMSGFAVSATRLGLPDTGLISYGEMVEQGGNICDAVNIPVIGDGDTGYGNAMNVKRTVRGYGRAGFACVMIEDQVAPKRCGHTFGKQVVDRDEALRRVRAAVDEGGKQNILIMARTDARETEGIEEALYRCQAFADLGADIIFLEAPLSIGEMRLFCNRISTPKMANMLQQGRTPLLPSEQLQEIGYQIAAYPLTLISAAVQAMQQALVDLKNGRYPEHIGFDELKKVIGFSEYDKEEKKYT